MKRRKFFETLGAALAGAALIKPDFSQAEEMIKIPYEPGEVICNPVDNLNYDNLPVGGTLFHGKKKITTFEGISYSYNRDWIDVSSMYSGYRSFIVGQEDHGVTLLGCSYSSKLREVYEKGDRCKMVIKMEDVTCIADNVKILEWGFKNRELQLKLYSNVEMKWI